MLFYLHILSAKKFLYQQIYQQFFTLGGLSQPGSLTQKRASDGGGHRLFIGGKLFIGQTAWRERSGAKGL